MTPTAKDRADLVEALKSAYPPQTRAFLYLRIASKMGIVVSDDVISLDKPGTIILDAIVLFADGQGRFLELLAATWTDKPGNPKLKALATLHLADEPDLVAKMAPASAPPTPSRLAPAVRPPLEKVITNRSPSVALAAYLQGLTRLSGAICTVSTLAANGELVVRGTGFLVGRSTVLTNFHVVRDAITAKAPGSSVSFTFGPSTGGAAGVVVEGAKSWLLSESPYSQSDLDGVGDPGADELDYALITLSEAFGLSRPPLSWPVAPPIVTQGDFLVIGQHPGGKAATVAFGEVVELPRSGLRFRYDVTTGPGSSGSPVLSVDLELVGLHHAADPRNNPKYNQAIPIARIMSRLKAENIALTSL